MKLILVSTHQYIIELTSVEACYTDVYLMLVAFELITNSHKSEMSHADHVWATVIYTDHTFIMCSCSMLH